MIESIAFLVFAGLTLGGAIGVVVARTVFIGALWLILSFLGVAGLYVLLDAGFLAMIQILVYVGAISVLILFAVMLTRDMMTERRPINRQWALGVMVALAVFGSLAALAYRADWPLSRGQVVPASGAAVVVEGTSPAERAALVPSVIARSGDDGAGTTYVVPGTIVALGRAFMTEYLLQFEVIGAMLLLAMVGAIVIARD
jgi:NADH-quinone oxidoreductase subunit J